MHSYLTGQALRLSHPTITQRLILVRKTICIFFLIGILLSFNLWKADRYFPLSPLIEGLQEFNVPLNALLLTSLILSIIFAIFSNRLIFLRILICSLLILSIQDQQRWQPWVYFYLLALIPLAVDRVDRHPKSILVCIQLVIIGVYFWSGIHKFSYNFINLTFTNILKDFFQIENETSIDIFKYGGFLVPLIEVLIATTLFVPRLRRIGCILVIAVHSFILIYLSPLGVDANSVVYPWNIAMILMTALLFYNQENTIALTMPGTWNMKLTMIVILLLVYILPWLNFIHRWDHYLSFSLYSDKIPLHYVAIEETQLEKIDNRMKRYFVNITGLSGGAIIDVNKWATAELNVPFYPETRVFKNVCRSMCGRGIDQEKLYFLEFQQPLTTQKFQRYTCEDLD